MNGPRVPYSEDAEASVLGAMLIDPGVFFSVSPLVAAGDFYVQKNRFLYEAIDKAAHNGGVDLVTVLDHLEREKTLAATGGMAYLTELIASVPSVLKAEQHARIVRDYAIRRDLLAAASDSARAAYDLDLDIEEVVAAAEGEIMAVRRGGHENRYTARELAMGIIDRAAFYVNNPLARGETRGLATGIAPLDTALSGLKNGLYIIAGRPSIGKTSLALQMMAGILDQGKRCVLFTIEMSAEQVVDRLATSLAGVSLQDFEQGSITEQQYNDVIMASGAVADWPLTIIDKSTLRPGDVLAGVRREIIERGDVAAVFIDGLWLMTPTRERENRVQTIGSISRELKRIQRELGAPFVVAHQLSRSCETRGDKRPLLSDLRDSGDVEQDADVALMLYREGYYDSGHAEANVMEIWIRKNRLGGAAGEAVKMFWHGALMRCDQLAKQPADLPSHWQD